MSSRQQSKFKVFAGVLLLVAIVGLFAFNYKSDGAVTAFVQKAVSPMFFGSNPFAHVTSKGNVATAISSKQTLASEIQSLRKQVDSMQSLVYENAYLRTQNKVLLSLLSGDTTLNSQDSTTVVPVYSTAGLSPYGTILLHLDKNTKVNVGSVVLAQNSIAIGNISKKVAKIATVQLFSANGREINVRVGDYNDPVIATAVGVGSGNFVLSLPREAHIKEGDFLYSESAIGHVIGIVGEIQADPAEATLHIRASTSVNMHNLTLVKVI